MEIVLIFVLSITSCYVVKMEMLLADTKLLSLPVILTENAVIQSGVNHAKQPLMMLEKGIHQTPGNLRFKVELALSYFIEKNYDKAKVLAEQVLAEKDLPEVVHNNILDFIVQIAAADQNYKKQTKMVRHKDNIVYGYDSNANIARKDAQIDTGQLLTSSVKGSDKFSAWLYDD